MTVRVDAPLYLVLALNNRHEVETSRLTRHRLEELWSLAFMARALGDEACCEGFLVAFDESAAYDNRNFAWFAARFPRFVYVDRLVTAPHARRRGIASSLYAEVIAKARAASQSRIGCEINVDPPNPASDRLHEALGFEEIGRAAHAGKTVRYMMLRL